MKPLGKLWERFMVALIGSIALLMAMFAVIPLVGTLWPSHDAGRAVAFVFGLLLVAIQYVAWCSGLMNAERARERVFRVFGCGLLATCVMALFAPKPDIALIATNAGLAVILIFEKIAAAKADKKRFIKEGGSQDGG